MGHTKFLTETDKIRQVTFDYTGAVILTLGLGSLIYAITEGREQAWPLWSILLLTGAVPLFFLFIRDQQLKLRRNKSPLIHTRLFRLKAFNIGLVAVLFHFMLHTAYLLMIAVFLQSGLGISALDCGIYFIPHALLFMLSSVIASRLLIRYGKKILQAGFLLIFISFLLQILLFNIHSSAATSILLLGLYGLGNGLVLPFLLNIVLNSIHTDYAGMASGIFSTFQQTAAALGISIIGGIFYTVLETDKSPDVYLHALQLGLSVNLACLLIAAVMLYLIPDNFRHPTEMQLDV